MNELVKKVLTDIENQKDFRAIKFAQIFLENSHYLKKVPDKEIEWAMTNGAEAVYLFFEAIKHRTRTSIRHVPKGKISPWKSILTGGLTNTDLYNQVSNLYYMGTWSRYFIRNTCFNINPENHKVNLVALPLEFFGFSEPVRTDVFLDEDFLRRWSSINLENSSLELCSPEDAYRLRQCYDNQPCGEILWTAMRPLEDLKGNHRILCVRRRNHGRRWIDACPARSTARWSLGVKFIFRLV